MQARRPRPARRKVYAHQRNVDSIGGGSAHHAGNDHARSCRLVAASRTSSLNSHNCRESLVSFAAVGAGPEYLSSLDFFLNARTRATDSFTRLANLASRSASFTSASWERNMFSST